MFSNKSIINYKVPGGEENRPCTNKSWAPASVCLDYTPIYLGEEVVVRCIANLKLSHYIHYWIYLKLLWDMPIYTVLLTRCSKILAMLNRRNEYSHHWHHCVQTGYSDPIVGYRFFYYYYSQWCSLADYKPRSLVFSFSETESTWYCGHYWPIVPVPDDRWWWLWSNWWNEDWQGKPKYSEKTCPSAILSTTNPT
jgi:hypothetical protein